MNLALELSSENTPIFIGGLMKSGTSLLRKLVSEHPAIFGGLETHWFTKDFNEKWKDGNSIRHQWLLEFFEVHEDEISEIRSSSKSALDFFSSFMDYCVRRSGKKRWVEKTPDNVFHADLIWSTWSNAQLIITRRNYLDIYASWKKNNKSDIYYFLEKVSEFEKIKNRLSSNEKVLFVSYEEMVLATAETMSEVFKFLGVPNIAGIEKYRGDDSDYDKVLEVTGKISATTESLKKPIFDSSIGQWKQVLTKDEIDILASKIGGEIGL